MRIVFITSSLDPGRDGVGDYTRRLAAEFIRRGHPSVIMGLNDSKVSQIIFESQESEGISVSALRLSNALTWRERAVEARNWLDTFDPDWVSLQFVPFGFHPKGLCFGLGKWLAAINPQKKWHIMFHELWLGLNEKSSAKHRLWGATQKIIIWNLINRLRPQIINTQAEPYRKVLDRLGTNTSVLPLFGNISRDDGDAWDGLLKPLVTQSMGNNQKRAGVYLAGVFGAVHPEWNAEQTVHTLFPLTQRFQKRLVIIFFGKNNLNPAAIDKLKSTLLDRADVIAVGERASSEISRILHSLDLGLATTPRQLIQKSGSVAAMLEHGLPVLVTRDDWRLRGADFQLGKISSRLLSPKEFAMLEALPIRESPSATERGVESVADRMLSELSAFPKSP